MITATTSIPWAVSLSWLENAYSKPLFAAGDFYPQSRSDWAVFGTQSGFIGRSMHTSLQVSVCSSSYYLFHPG